MAKSKNAVKDAAEAAQEMKPEAGYKFKIGGIAYQYVLPKINLPFEAIGIRTAQEALTDDTQYVDLGGKTINEYLVQIKSGAVAEISNS